MTLNEYIKKLKLPATYSSAETIYKINEYLSICLELYGHVFVIDYSFMHHKDIYTYIPDIETLKKVYFEKTSENIELLLRKEKLKKLNNYV